MDKTDLFIACRDVASIDPLRFFTTVTTIRLLHEVHAMKRDVPFREHTDFVNRIVSQTMDRIMEPWKYELDMKYSKGVAMWAARDLQDQCSLKEMSEMLEKKDQEVA